MQDVLKQLGIAASNSGACSGSEWAEGNGKLINKELIT